MSKTVPHVFHQEGELLSKPLLQSMTHQHSKVRTACVEVCYYYSYTAIKRSLYNDYQQDIDKVTCNRLSHPLVSLKLSVILILFYLLLLTRAWAEGYSNRSVCLCVRVSVCYQVYSHNSAFYVLYNMAIDRALTIL